MPIFLCLYLILWKFVFISALSLICLRQRFNQYYVWRSSQTRIHVALGKWRILSVVETQSLAILPFAQCTLGSVLIGLRLNSKLSDWQKQRRYGSLFIIIIMLDLK